MEQLVMLVLTGLATWQAVEVWRHSALLADLRAAFEEDDTFLGDILACPWCLSIYVALVIALWCFVFYGTILMLPVYALAASRMANVLNDVTYSFSRTPKDEDEQEE